jgi:hypothetical protein
MRPDRWMLYLSTPSAWSIAIGSSWPCTFSALDIAEALGPVEEAWVGAGAWAISGYLVLRSEFGVVGSLSHRAAGLSAPGGVSGGES